MFDLSMLAEYLFYVLVLLIAGAGEYLKLAPAGTFAPLLAFIIGHFLGNVPTKAAINKNTDATKENTQAIVQQVPPTGRVENDLMRG